MNYLKKNITTVNCGILVQGCNTKGVMGSGVALALRRKWPVIFENYSKLCQQHKNDSASLLGKLDLVLISIDPTLYVANLFSQEYYGNDGATYANPIAILTGLSHIFSIAAANNLPIHSVKIGCGLGGLDWEKDVKPIFDQLEYQYPLVPIYIYEL